MPFNFTEEYKLENTRVQLRPLMPADATGLEKITANQSDLAPYSPHQLHTPEYLQQFIDASLTERRLNTRYPFLIIDKPTGIYAGSTSIANVSNIDGRLEIGWTWLGKEFRKTGLNRNCKFLLLQFAFEQLQFERVELKTDERNKVSRRAIEKIGGQYEGCLRHHMLMADGHRRNTVYYSILKHEWPSIKNTVFNNLC